MTVDDSGADAPWEPLLIVVHDTDVLVREFDGVTTLPPRPLILPWAGSAIPLGRLGDRDCFGAAASAGVRAAPPTGLRFVPVRALFTVLPASMLEIVGRAIALVEFEIMHGFCGRCAGATEAAPGERARHCPACGATFHPRIPPAVIAVVARDDGRILLARSARFPPGMFSAVAGFVETGESLEQAVCREVAEEVGVRIDNLRYFGSQPWPFGRSLMVGYFAHHAGGEILVDGTEIVDARWFAPDQLPMLPPPISIARKLIDAWIARGGEPI